MNETTLNLIKECTVRILVGQNKSFGSGFFVAPGLVLTCSHVIEDGQQSDTSVSIIVQWKKEQYKAQVVKAFPKPFPDIALLGIESPISHPCAYLNSNINIGENLYIFGFSDEQPDGDSAMLTYEVQQLLFWKTKTRLCLKCNQARLGLVLVVRLYYV